jgi:hypothetical protein
MDSISSFLQNIDTGKVSSQDEATLKQTVILRMFSLLGWNIFDPDEVRPEYTIGGKKVDYALCTESSPRVFIEVKRPGENLSNHQEQLLNYSFMQGIRLAVLTNGVTWWFYLPLQEASWEQRKYDSMELDRVTTQNFAEKITKYLSRENVETGEAVTNATQAYKDQRRRQILDNVFPRVWDEVVNPHNPDFIDLLNATVEEETGFRASPKQLENYITRKTSIRPPPKPGKLVTPRRRQYVDEEASYWIIPATLRDSIQRLVKQEQMWAFGENTGGKSSLKTEDRMIFYLSGKGIVAHAEVASEPRYIHHEKVNTPEKYPWVFNLKDPEVYLDTPVKINKEKRTNLDAFRGKENSTNWGWFVMGSHTITQNDYYELIRTN